MSDYIVLDSRGNIISGTVGWDEANRIALEASAEDEDNYFFIEQLFETECVYHCGRCF